MAYDRAIGLGREFGANLGRIWGEFGLDRANSGTKEKKIDRPEFV
jgi:hypothetical protein